MARRIKVGDVVEIPTQRGLAYAQYILTKDEWGALIRVLPGFFEKRPANVCELVKEQQRFVTFFPLQAAVNRKILDVVNNCDVPQAAREFPLFRAAGHVDRAGRVCDWWLWDGEREWRIGQLLPEHLKLPIRSIPNDTKLIEDIEQDWTPETDSRTLRSLASMA